MVASEDELYKGFGNRSCKHLWAYSCRGAGKGVGKSDGVMTALKMGREWEGLHPNVFLPTLEG